MSQIVYVKEYQPSSASLRIGGDPIYKESLDTEKITVGAPSPFQLIILSALGVLLWIVTREE